MIVAKVARLEQVAPEERLNPEKLMQDLKAAGKNADHLFDVDAVVVHASKNVQGGDVVVVSSNGGFGRIHTKLIQRLGRRQPRWENFCNIFENFTSQNWKSGLVRTKFRS